MINKLFDQFLANVLYQNIEVSSKDNQYQCMDLAYAWIFCLGMPKGTIQHLYAYEVYTQPNALTHEHFELIKNSVSAVPQKGDLVVFSNKLGVAGHICIATGTGDTKSFQSVDQNWDGKKQAPTLITHNYSNVLGWLRPKLNWPTQELIVTYSTRIPQLENKEVQQIKSEIEAKDRRIYNLEQQPATVVETIVEKVIEKEKVFTNVFASSLYALASLIEGKSAGTDGYSK